MKKQRAEIDRALGKLEALIDSPPHAVARRRQRAAINSLRVAMLADFIELSVLTIEGCYYHADMDGWIQPCPPEAGQSAPTLTFRLRNRGFLATQGRVRATLDGVELMSWGTENEVNNLSAGASLEGRFWYYGLQGSIQPRRLVVTYEEASPNETLKQFNPSTGTLDSVPLYRVVARVEHLYIAAEGGQLAAALITALNITPEYDQSGRLIGASAVDRNGVLRSFRITLLGKRETWDSPKGFGPTLQRLTLTGVFTYAEQRLNGRPHSYDQNDYGIPDTTTPGRVLSAGVTLTFDSSGSTLVDVSCAVVGFPQGSEVTGGNNPPVNNLAYGGSVEPAWSDRGAVIAVPQIQLKGKWNGTAVHGDFSWFQDPTLGRYTGANLDVLSRFPDETARAAYFGPLINEQATLASIFGALPDSPPVHGGPSISLVTQFVNRSVSANGAASAKASARRRPAPKKAKSAPTLLSFRVGSSTFELDGAPEENPYYKRPWWLAAAATAIAAARWAGCRAVGFPAAPAQIAGISVCGIGYALAFLGTWGLAVAQDGPPPPLPLLMPPWQPPPTMGTGRTSPPPMSTPDQPVHDPYNPAPFGSMDCPPGYYLAFGACWPIGTSPIDRTDQGP